jgi:hypothetical protein
MSDNAFTPEQCAKISARLAREFSAWLHDHSIEPHYTAEEAAERLGKITVRTIWNYVKLWQTTGGKDGIGPVVKISHKVVLIPASALKRWLDSRTITATPPAASDGEERAA